MKLLIFFLPLIQKSFKTRIFEEKRAEENGGIKVCWIYMFSCVLQLLLFNEFPLEKKKKNGNSSRWFFFIISDYLASCQRWYRRWAISIWWREAYRGGISRVKVICLLTFFFFICNKVICLLQKLLHIFCTNHFASAYSEFMRYSFFIFLSILLSRMSNWYVSDAIGWYTRCNFVKSISVLDFGTL